MTQITSPFPTESAAGSGRTGQKARRKPPVVIAICLVVLATLVVAAVFSPYLEPHRPTAQRLLGRLEPPAFMGGSSEHLLGTDHLGRDITSRLLRSLRTTLMIAGLGTIIGFTVGVLLGLISGLGGNTLDNVIMFLVDVQLAVPFTLVALTVIALFGTSLAILVPVIGLAGWSQYARLTRGQVLSTREMPFVEAVEALGGSRLRVAARHVLPNITSPLIVLATYTFSQIMLLESALSFLGLGVQPPNMSLGSMVGAGRDHLIGAWWVAMAPATLLIVITMSLSLVGDWVRDVLDPRLQT
jgi:peptide/nickel transport system permease protein